MRGLGCLHTVALTIVVLALCVNGQSPLRPFDPTNLWVPQTSSTARPQARFAHSSASIGQTVVIFGGFQDSIGHSLNDTWAYASDSRVWHDSCASGPAGRGFFTMVTLHDGSDIQDESTFYAVLFGGISFNLTSSSTTPSDTLFNDIWTLQFTFANNFPDLYNCSSSSKWQLVNSGADLSTSPSPRFGHTCASAQFSSIMYCFGGRDASFILADLWSFDLTTGAWTLSASGLPLYTPIPPTLDAVRELLDDANSPYSGNVNVTRSNSTMVVPSARYLHVSFMIDDYLVVAAGYSPPGQCLSNGIFLSNGLCYDTWKYRNDTGWFPVSTQPYSIPISCIGMNSVAIGSSAYAVGYSSYSILNSVLQYVNTGVSTGSWTVVSQQLIVDFQLRRFASLSLVYVTGRDNIVTYAGIVVGGETTEYPVHVMNETWALGSDGVFFVWADESPPIYTPPFYDMAACVCSSTVGDSLLLFVFGGQMVGAPIARELWALDSFTNVWQRVGFDIPAEYPSRRLGASMVTWTEAANGFILFGGADPSSALVMNDVWSFQVDRDATWTLINPTGVSPPGRYRHVATALSRLEMLIFGGVGIVSSRFAALNDTWIYTGDPVNPFGSGTWSNARIVGAPPPSRSQSVLVFMPANPSVPGSHNCVYLFGGLSAEEQLLDDLWQLCLPSSLEPSQWVSIPLAAATSNSDIPSGRCGHAATALGEKIIVYGGSAVVQRVIPAPNIDLYSFHTVTKVWQLLQPSSAPVAGPADSGPIQGLLGSLMFNTTAAGNIFVYGGIAALATADLLPGTLGVVTPGCSAGFFPRSSTTGAPGNFFVDDCSPCPMGYFASTAGQTVCEACPDGLWTTGTGSVNASLCNVCKDGYCGQGDCAVSAGGAPLCTCNPLWDGERCEKPTGVLIVVGSLFVAFVLWVLVYYGMRIRRLRAKEVEVRSRSGWIQARLETTKELHDILDQTLIDVEELTLGDVVGSGVTGRVLKGTWQHQAVAVKFLHAAFAEGDTSMLDDFFREILLLRYIRHPNIVKFYGAGIQTLEGRFLPFVVVEYMKDGSLREFLDRHGPGTPELSWKSKIDLARGGAEGMRYLHSLPRPILHCDLKSPNLLVLGMTVKVADFGNAKLMQKLQIKKLPNANAASVMATSNTIQELDFVSDIPDRAFFGSLYWQAPESFNQNWRFTMPADVYGFGIILWEIATCRLPYEELYDDDTDIQAYVCGGGRPTLPDNVSSWPERYVQVMQQAWSGSEHDRPTFEKISFELMKIVETGTTDV